MISTFVTEGRLAVHFPRLMRQTGNQGLIVLFANPNLGTVVAVGHGEEIHTVGDISDGWDPECFEVFEGEVSLCNEADDGCEGSSFFDDEDAEDCCEPSCEVCQAEPEAVISGTVDGKLFVGTLAELIAKIANSTKITGALRG
jgi:hypothetical protein